MWSRSVVLTLHCNLKHSDCTAYFSLSCCSVFSRLVAASLSCQAFALTTIGQVHLSRWPASLPIQDSNTLQNKQALVCAHAAAHVKAFCRALGLRPTPVPATSSIAGPGKPVPSLCSTTTATAQTCLCLSCLQGPTALAWPAAAMCSRQ